MGELDGIMAGIGRLEGRFDESQKHVTSSINKFDVRLSELEKQILSMKIDDEKMKGMIRTNSAKTAIVVSGFMLIISQVVYMALC